MGPNCQSKIHLELLGKGLATMKMLTFVINHHRPIILAASIIIMFFVEYDDDANYGCVDNGAVTIIIYPHMSSQ